MLSPRYTLTIQSSKKEAINTITMPEMKPKLPVLDNNDSNVKMSLYRSQNNIPIQCYESVMPPPPHNMFFNNGTKTYNKNPNWNNQKRVYKDSKNDRQITENCDIEINSKTASTKKSPENKSLKGVHQKNVVIQSLAPNNFYNPNIPGDSIPGICHTHYFSFLSQNHPHNGYYHKQRYYSNRQDRPRNKRTLSFNSEPPNSFADAIMQKFLSRSNHIDVKKQPVDLLSGSQWDVLSKQIWDTFVSCQQNEDVFKKKLLLWKHLYTVIRRVFPRYGLFLVGSTMSGFGSNTSDVDMCLLVRPTYVEQRSEALHYLEQIQYALKSCDFVDKFELILAKVPILKFRDSLRNLEVDLNCNNSVGIRNTHLLHCYANMDWRVRPLVLIVKMWANGNNINDAKNMTISSYSLALMVIHYLQCGVTPPVVPCLHGLYPNKFNPDSDIHDIDMQERLAPFLSDNRQSLGELLLGFLHYYATFNYALHAISVRLGARIPVDECRFARSHKNDPHQWKHLCIEEPFDLTNTARSVYDPISFQRIKGVFLRSYNTLQERRDLVSIFTLSDADQIR